MPTLKTKKAYSTFQLKQNVINFKFELLLKFVKDIFRQIKSCCNDVKLADVGYSLVTMNRSNSNEFTLQLHGDVCQNHHWIVLSSYSFLVLIEIPVTPRA